MFNLQSHIDLLEKILRETFFKILSLIIPKSNIFEIISYLYKNWSIIKIHENSNVSIYMYNNIQDKKHTNISCNRVQHV